MVKVTGFRLDQIQSVVKLFSEEIGKNKVSDLPAASKQFFERSEVLMEGKIYITGEPWTEVLCRTLIADYRDRSSSERKFLLDAVRQYEEAKIYLASPDSWKNQSMNSWGH
jgi:hypothetical protein